MIYATKFFEDWSKDFNKHDKYLYLKLYGLIWIAGSLTSILKQSIKVLCTYRVASKTHNMMAFSLLHSRLQRFLEVVPYGQIQNRFSQDIRQVDLESVTSFYWLTHFASQVLTQVGAILLVVSYQLIFLIGIWIFVMTRIEALFMSARREYNRLMAISVSPMINNFSDTIKGLTYIRTMQLDEFFRAKMVHTVAERVKNKVLDEMLTAWFSMRCELSQKFLIVLPAMVGILYLWEDIDPSNIGLFFVCVFSMSDALKDVFVEKTDWETVMVSLERCQYFNNLEPETGYKNFQKEKLAFGKGGKKRLIKCLKNEKRRYRELIVGAQDPNREAKRVGSDGKEVSKVKKDIGSSEFERVVKAGALQFEGVYARYQGAETDTLKNINLSINAGEKIGIVGRSGSGKSTIIKLFWKYMTPRKGKILIDGTDITASDLKSLRSQITLITQETALFEGTLRQNLDPAGYRFSDDKLRDTLLELEFENQSYLEKGLEMRLDAEGSNLSQGEKQLICFARAILQPSKLVLFDEATANIDLKTEEIIQRSVKKRFVGCTMIVVAHRVQTVLECDRIVVMDLGRVQEFGTPEELIRKESGFFKEIFEKMKSVQ